jgi:hypothetical protein
VPEKQAQNAHGARLAVVGKGADCAPVIPLVSEGRTLLDDSSSALDEALARALDAAREAGKWDVVAMLVGTITGRRIA